MIGMVQQPNRCSQNKVRQGIELITECRWLRVTMSTLCMTVMRMKMRQIVTLEYAGVFNSSIQQRKMMADYRKMMMNANGGILRMIGFAAHELQQRRSRSSALRSAH